MAEAAGNEIPALTMTAAIGLVTVSAPDSAATTCVVSVAIIRAVIRILSPIGTTVPATSPSIAAALPNFLIVCGSLNASEESFWSFSGDRRVPR